MKYLITKIVIVIQMEACSLNQLLLLHIQHRLIVPILHTLPIIVIVIEVIVIEAEMNQWKNALVILPDLVHLQITALVVQGNNKKQSKVGFLFCILFCILEE